MKPNFLVHSLWMISMLLASGLFTIEQDVDFEPTFTWETGDDGKKHRTNRQEVDQDGKPLWRLPLRVKLLKYGRTAREDAFVTISSVATPRVADIPPAADAVRLMTSSAAAKRGFPTSNTKED